MKLTTRRIAAGISVVAAAVLLPAVALASSASPAAPAIARCTAHNTQVWIGEPGDGTAGPIFFQLEFSNIGHAACSLTGYPGVSALRNGHIVGKPASHSGAISTITVPAGGTAHVVLGVTPGGFFCNHPVNADILKVFPPNQFGSQELPFATSQCPGKSAMKVDAMHANTGIPGHSAS
jgi:Protein of unknown function (DUF4232)